MSNSTRRIGLIFLVLFATTGTFVVVAAEHRCQCENGGLDCLETSEPVRWACQEPYALRSLSARVMNSSTVELLIELPDFALDQKGKIELNFTSQTVSKSDKKQPLGGNPDEEQPPTNAVWSSRPKIETPNGLLTKSQINYLWTDLRPGHKYWFKVSVYIEIKNAENVFAWPLESAVQTVTMPQLDIDVVSNPLLPALITLVPKSIQIATKPAATTPTPRTIMTAAPTVVPTTTTTAKPPPTTTLPTSTTTAVTEPTTTITQEPSTVSSLSAYSTNLNINDVLSMWVPGNMTDRSFVTVGQTLAKHIKIERYAWHFLVALSIMTVLFVIVSYLYCKKSRVIAPNAPPYYLNHDYYINNHMPPAYEVPTFTKLVSYYANKPHLLLLNEMSDHQNYDNMVKQKNLDADDTSASHRGNSNTQDDEKCPERAIY